ncbi:MAG: PHP domain-containing protein, partial [Anaerolineae bacterium]
MPELWKVDLHCHSWFSRDCLMNPRAIIETARVRGLDKLAITEHNNVEGARYLKRLAPDLIIIGEEVKSSAGEFIAYFVQEEVPKGLSPEETLARLREQGAVISIPHPADSFRRSALGEANARRFIDQVDAIEVFNARCLYRDDNDAALALARRYGKLITA